MHLVLAAIIATAAAPPDAEMPPNVVIILIDDMGWADAGCCGSRYYETPHMDRLAREGMRFTDGYAACAVCSPSRAALLTGRWPTRIGITDWIRPLDGTEWTEDGIREQTEYAPAGDRALATPRNPRWMEHDEVTIAEALEPLGYATGFIGKWHLGPEGWWPEDQGFDDNVGGCSFGHPPHYFDPYPAKHQRITFPNLEPRLEGEYLTDREADAAVDFIRKNAGQPFFLHLCHYAVHSPIQAKEEVVARYRTKPTIEGDGQDFAPYAAMVESVDDALGRVLETLEDVGVAERTLVIFTSDNGGAVHFRATDNRPLRSGKGRPYEGGLRAPFLVYWPGRVPAGVESSTPVCGIDILPTVCAATGAPLPDGRVVDGVDLMPVLTGTGSVDRTTLYWHYPHYWWGGRLTPYSAIRHGEWKMIMWYETGVRELYHLADDASESRDRAADEPEVLEDLCKRLEAWLEETGAKLPRTVER